MKFPPRHSLVGKGRGEIRESSFVINKKKGKDKQARGML
jgi:hypothetical protein